MLRSAYLKYSAIFKSVEAAKVAGTLVYICAFIFLLPTALLVTSSAAKVGLSFMPPLAYSLSISVIYALDVVSSSKNIGKRLLHPRRS